MSKKETTPATATAVTAHQPMLMKTYNGKVLVPISNALLSGWVSGEAVDEVKALPPVEWRGCKMPWSLYCEISSFFRLVYQSKKTEATVRLYYDTENSAWDYAVFPQKASAASAEEIKNHPENAAISGAVRGVQVGSIHSHAAMTAFQSFTDAADEEKSDGLHITLGKMDETELDIHSRVMLKGNEYPSPCLTSWISLPPWSKDLPTAAQRLLSSWCFKNPDLVNVKLALVDRVEEKFTALPGFGASGYGYGSFGYDNRVAETEYAPADDRTDDNGYTDDDQQTVLLLRESEALDMVLQPMVERAYPKSLVHDVLELMDSLYDDCYSLDMETTSSVNIGRKRRDGKRCVVDNDTTATAGDDADSDDSDDTDYNGGASVNG